MKTKSNEALIPVLLGLSVLTASCTKATPPPVASTTPQAKEAQVKAVWTCPMHPQIRQDGPGKCPICGMELVRADSSAPGANAAQESSAPSDHVAFHLNAERQQLIGVKTGTVEKKALFKSVEAAGRVAFDPELYTAQNEYQEAIRQQDRVKNSPLSEVRHSAMSMVESAKMRLKILGLSDKQIEQLRESGGTGSNLLIPKPGESIWVYAEVFEMDLHSVQPGLEARITGGSLGEREIQGKVASVDRVINPTTRTAKVRIMIPNAKALLRPEAFVNVTILSPLGEQITIPFDAVLDTGKEAWVFITDGKGGYEPRKITIRYRAGDEVAVESGVRPGEKIVTSANFLIDSESRLKAVR